MIKKYYIALFIIFIILFTKAKISDGITILQAEGITFWKPL